MKHLVTLILLFWSVTTWACSCAGISSIDETIAMKPVLVEAQVVSLERVTSREYGSQVRSATLRVTKTLKGSGTAGTITVEHFMCYASLYPDIMEVGHTYILPLSRPSSRGRHAMAACAHSGMELVSGKLYTFEQTDGIQRRLQFYKDYPEFLAGLKK